MKTADNPKDIADAVKNNVSELEITGNWADRTVKLKATGEASLYLAVGIIGIAMTATLLSLVPGPGTVTDAAVKGFAAPAAIAIVGLPTALAISGLMLASGGVVASKKLFKKLRNDYVVVEEREGYALLRKK